MNENKLYNKTVKIFYSTLENYFNSLHQSDVEFPDYNDIDFFPYTDTKKHYWTGFFTSRPFIKGVVRETGKYLSVANKIYLEEILDRKLSNKLLQK